MTRPAWALLLLVLGCGSFPVATGESETAWAVDAGPGAGGGAPEDAGAFADAGAASVDAGGLVDAYHAELTSQITHPYRTPPMMPASGLGDGLNIFARFDVGSTERHECTACYGVLTDSSDCLAPKGFSFNQLTLKPGVVLDVYHLHGDAGRSADDAAARAGQMAQLTAFVNAHSAGRALIVAGDTNMGRTDESLSTKVVADLGVTDACRLFASCTNTARYDRVFFRSSAALTLTATSYAVDRSFVDGSGKSLSDHYPVSVSFTWEAH